MGFLTTHVLDTAHGRPATGVRIDLYRIDDGRHHLRSATTNNDGRCDQPLLPENEFRVGKYELIFHAGDYFAAIGETLPEPKFLDQVVIRFGIADESQHYHVPLLVSPFGYSTYRGS
jgi:5-hydroxyisourate hydrolase